MRGYKCIHGVAHCENCEWYSQDYNDITKMARKHHLHTGHIVTVELGFWKQYKKKSLPSKEGDKI